MKKVITATSCEMPAPPNYEELCENSDLIVCGKLIDISDKNSPLKLNYSEHYFEVCERYFGQEEKKTISVLLPMDCMHPNYISQDTYSGCSRTPAYHINNKYFLFLSHFKKGIYVRNKLDRIFEERAYGNKDEILIKSEIEEINRQDRWMTPEDNLTYRIPPDAIAIEQEPLRYRIRPEIVYKHVKYQKEGQTVGERAWYPNGQLSFDDPIKNNLSHGIHSGWRENGRPYGIECYRKGRYHGFVIRWHEANQMELLFWIRGKLVSKRKYLKECKRNATLPKLIL